MLFTTRILFAFAVAYSLAPLHFASAAPIVKPNLQMQKRLEKALRMFESRDEEATVELVITDIDGSRKVRNINIQRAGDAGEQRMVARITAPTDLKGTSLLSVIANRTENQWVYLPSSKQTRKILTAEHKDTGILGSELRYEDFNPSVIRQAQVSFLKTEKRDNKTYDVFETRVPRGVSVYETAQIWIENGADVPTEINYFAKNEKIKTIQFLDYKAVGNVMRPHRMVISNLKNKRGTEIRMANYQINKGLPVQRLSVESLSKTW